MRMTASLLLAAAVLLAASCKKEDLYEGRQVTLQVTVENESKTYMNDHLPNWHEGDEFYVNNNTAGTAGNVSGGDCEIAGIPAAAHYTVVYPKSIVQGTPDITSAADIAVSVPRCQNYETDAGGNQKIAIPMCGISSGDATQVSFLNVGALLKVVVSDLSEDEQLDSIVVEHTHASLSGSGTIVNAQSAAPVLKCTGAKQVSLVCGTGMGNGEYYLAVPSIASQSGCAFTIKVCTHVSGPREARCYSRTQAPGNGFIGRSQMATIPFAVSAELAGPFEFAYFKVAENQKAAFAPGNLQWSYDFTWYFRFAGSQESYLGNNQEQPGGSYSHIGPDYTPGENTYRDLLPWGNTTDCSRNGAFTCGSSFAEWGEKTIHMGWLGQELATGYWTMTKAEWNAVIADSRKGGAMVNGVCGVLLLPHNWAGCPAELTFTDGFASGFNTNVYSGDDWNQMNACGVLFLPACGYGSCPMLAQSLTVSDVGTEGRYWVKDNKTDYVKVDASGISVVTSGRGSGLIIPPSGEETYNYAVRLAKTL